MNGMKLAAPAPASLVDPSLLSQLQQAMDTEQLLPELSRHWNRSSLPQELTLERVFPRGAKGFLLEYRLTLADATGVLQQENLLGELIGDHVEEHRRALVDRLHSGKRRQLKRSEGDHGIFSLPHIGLLFRPAGLDHRLHGLGIIQRTSLLADALAQFAPQEPLSKGQKATLLGHRLERRAVARLSYRAAQDGRRRSLIAKFYKHRSDRGARVFALMERLWAGDLGSDPQRRITKPLGYDPAQNVLYMEDVRGTAVHELTDLQLPQATEGAAELLAQLHHQPIDIQTHWRTEHELTTLHHWVSLTSTMFPQLAELAGSAYRRSQAELDGLRRAQCCFAHRDYYEKQVIVHGGQAVMLDLDTATQADPALDIGNYLAHIQLAELQGRGHYPPLVDCFCRGYAHIRQLPPLSAIAIYRRASLLRIACIHAFWRRWHHLAEPLLEACHEN